MTVLLQLAPAMLVLALLWLGRYPGERRLLALRARTPTRRAPITRTVARRHTPTPPRGGALLATSLAGRAPPTPIRI